MPPPESLPPPPPPPGDGPPEGDITRYLQRYRAGDPHAINALLAHTYARFGDLARKMLHRDFSALRREVETGDVLDQGVIELKQALKNWTPASSEHVVNFAAKVMRRNLLDLARKVRRRPRAESGVDQLPGALAGPEEVARRGEVHEAIDRVIREHEHLRQVIELRFYQDLTCADAAVVLRVDEKTVQRHWAMALGLLRQYLGGGDQ